MAADQYSNPLVGRYASQEMSWIFSNRHKFLTWRKCWIALATAEQELGLDISHEQLQEMKENLENLDLDRANEYEDDADHATVLCSNCDDVHCAGGRRRRSHEGHEGLQSRQQSGFGCAKHDQKTRWLTVGQAGG